MKNRTQKAFTMVELVFVIVVIGILAAVAVPKLAVTRDDAIVTKAMTTVSSVRNAVATERQKRILRGDFDPITSLSSDSGYDKPIFDGFDGNTSSPVLEYPPISCAAASSKGCWVDSGDGDYTFVMPVSGTAVFTLSNNRFVCKSSTDENCQELTK
ncbi:MAG TPA: prepilin-type cleavage/methylation domain-containing protein [Sulfurovum sp. UBA12169]|nr:MAG TPA: prepilin-type cleavage/methylation domain-containing protein [Sulfurovum sp. UBA12169]